MIAGALAMVMLLGPANEAWGQAAPSQEPVTFVGAASCIDAEGKYLITWTLTLALGDQETASAGALFNEVDEVDGLDLIGQPQTGEYPFSGEAGNLFTSGGPRLVNGPNVATTPMDTRSYNPETLTASGMIVSPIRTVDVEATVTRPEVCAAAD
jgi:hypothetical protein